MNTLFYKILFWWGHVDIHGPCWPWKPCPCQLPTQHQVMMVMLLFYATAEGHATVHCPSSPCWYLWSMLQSRTMFRSIFCGTTRSCVDIYHARNQFDIHDPCWYSWWLLWCPHSRMLLETMPLCMVFPANANMIMLLSALIIKEAFVAVV